MKNENEEQSQFRDEQEKTKDLQTLAYSRRSFNHNTQRIELVYIHNRVSYFRGSNFDKDTQMLGCDCEKYICQTTSNK